MVARDHILTADSAIQQFKKVKGSDTEDHTIELKVVKAYVRQLNR